MKQRSSIPIILRDMAPPEGSIFDPAKKWDEEKKRRQKAVADGAKEDAAAAAAADKKKGSNKKGGGAKKSTADSIKESNAAEKLKKESVSYSHAMASTGVSLSLL